MTLPQSHITDSGENPEIYMDLATNNQILGRIYIKCYRSVFPKGVENFVALAAGDTYREINNKMIRRTYKGSLFFGQKYGQYLMGGDIYHNTGSDAGTIYDDESIPPELGDCYISHEIRGQISLVPYRDHDTDKFMFDSTFMITLAPLPELDDGQVVIGEITRGIAVINEINRQIKPFAGRSYPKVKIHDCGVLKREFSNAITISSMPSMP